MKPEIIKRQGLRKVCKLAERSEGEKKEIFSAAIKLFRMFDDIECIKIYNEDNDVIFKVRLADNDYRYVKIVFVNNDSFDLINLDFSQRRIGRTNLFNEIIKSIQQSQSIDRQTRIEILNYIDFKRNRKKLIWMLADTAFDTYYILTENMIKDLILEDIEYNFIKNNNQENYSCSIPKFIIHKYWTNMLIRRRKSDYELWKNIL